MRYIETDRRGTDARNLKSDKRRKERAGGGGGKEIMHGYETGEKTKKKKEIRAK
jgi:hypothetical protein